MQLKIRWEKENVREILEKVDCLELVAKLGYALTSHSKMSCVWHLDKTPSLQVHKNKFHCFGCGKNADAIDFLRHIKQFNFKESLEYLSNGKFISSEAANMQFQNVNFEKCMENENFVTRLKCLQHIEEFLNDVTQKKIQNRKTPRDLYKWMERRGFNIELLFLNYTEHNLLFVCEIKKLHQYVKQKVPKFMNSNLFNKNQEIKWFSYDYGLAFPIWNEHGITSMRVRNLIGENPKDVELPGIVGMPSGFGWMGYKYYQEHSLPSQDKKTIMLVEGAPDMLAGMELAHGNYNIEVLSTGNVKKAELVCNLEMIKNCERLILCFDDDPIGHETTERVAYAAKMIGIKNIEKANLEGAKDLNDYLITKKLTHPKVI